MPCVCSGRTRSNRRFSTLVNAPLPAMATSQPVASRRCRRSHSRAATPSASAVSTQVSPRWVRVANHCSTAADACACRPAASASSSAPQVPGARPLSASSASAAPARASVQAEVAMAATNTQRACAGNMRPSGAPACCRRRRKPVKATLPSRANDSTPAIHQPRGCCASRAPMSVAVKALEVVVMEIVGPFFGCTRRAGGPWREAVGCTEVPSIPLHGGCIASSLPLSEPADKG